MFGMPTDEEQIPQTLYVYNVDVQNKTIYFAAKEGTFLEQRSELLDILARNFYVAQAKDKLGMVDAGMADITVIIVDTQTNTIISPVGRAELPESAKPIAKVRFESMFA